MEKTTKTAMATAVAIVAIVATGLVAVNGVKRTFCRTESDRKCIPVDGAAYAELKGRYAGMLESGEPMSFGELRETMLLYDAEIRLRGRRTVRVAEGNWVRTEIIRALNGK